MKIAIIVRRLNVRGGTQKQAIMLARELQRRGHDTSLYTFLLDRERCYTDLLQDLRIVSLDAYPSSRNVVLDFFSEYRAAAALARLIAADTQLLHPHDQVSYRVAWWFKKRVRNIPSVWMMNDMPSKTWGYWRDREAGDARHVSVLRRMIWRILDILDTRAIRVQNAIAVLDERDRKYVRDAYGKEATVIRSGIDPAAFPYRERSGIGQGSIVRILAVGILFPHRRYEDLIEAVRILRERGVAAICEIVGGFESAGGYKKKLDDLVATCGVRAYVSFAGKISDADLVGRYRESDVFVFPSHMQSWGLAVFEAMSCGLPVVVSASAGAAEVLEHGTTALVVPPQSPEAIADAVQMLAADQARYRDISAKGATFVASHMSWSRYADDMLRVFSSIKS